MRTHYCNRASAHQSYVVQIIINADHGEGLTYLWDYFRHPRLVVNLAIGVDADVRRQLKCSSHTVCLTTTKYRLQFSTFIYHISW